MSTLPWYLRARLKPRQLLLLVALADEGNIHRASEILRMAQPGASKLLKDLEDMLGVELFERHSRGMRPTWYGDSLIRHARMVLTTLEEAGEELEALKGGRYGKVGVGAVTSPGLSLLPRAIALVKKEQPHLHVSVQVETSDVLLDRLNRADLEMIVGRLLEGSDTTHLTYQRLGYEPVCAIVRPGHPLLQRADLTLETLSKAEWVMPPEGSVLRYPFDKMFLDAGVESPAVVVDSSSLLFIIKMLQSSDFLAVVASDIARYYAENGMAAILPIDLPCHMDAFGLITRSDRLLSPAAKKVLRALQTTAAAMYGINLKEDVPRERAAARR
jgi:DNA-binding transcriptional LysR family regulator